MVVEANPEKNTIPSVNQQPSISVSSSFLVEEIMTCWKRALRTEAGRAPLYLPTSRLKFSPLQPQRGTRTQEEDSGMRDVRWPQTTRPRRMTHSPKDTRALSDESHAMPEPYACGSSSTDSTCRPAAFANQPNERDAHQVLRRQPPNSNRIQTRKLSLWLQRNRGGGRWEGWTSPWMVVGAKGMWYRG